MQAFSVPILFSVFNACLAYVKCVKIPGFYIRNEEKVSTLHMSVNIFRHSNIRQR